MDQKYENQEYILFTSSNFPSGGAGAFYLNLFCKGMVLNDCQIRVYLTRGHAFGDNSTRISRRNKTSDGVSYTYLGFIKRPHAGYLKLLDDFLSFFSILCILPTIIWKRKRVTFLVYHTDFSHSLPIYIAARLFNNRIITFVPEYFNKAQFTGVINKLQWYSFILTFNHLNRLSDGIIVFSNFLRDIYLKKGVKEEQIFVQPNLTDFDFWNSSPVTEKYTIGYSGTPGIKDGLVDLFKAISHLKNKLPISLIVVGDSPFGKSMIPFLETECENLGIRSMVHFTGLVEYDQVKNNLLQCKILAITRPKNIQTQAGFPTKMGEYMALKKPVLATDFGEVETYFSDNKEIVIAKCGDTISIASKIKWMVENEDLIKTIAINGYKKANELFEYKTSMAKIINFIQENDV
jgi:glycosyltransferase involved in cell wall biosynthesis